MSNKKIFFSIILVIIVIAFFIVFYNKRILIDNIKQHTTKTIDEENIGLINGTWEKKSETQDGKLVLLITIQSEEMIEYIQDNDKRIDVNGKTTIGLDFVADKNTKYTFKIKTKNSEERDISFDTSEDIVYSIGSNNYPTLTTVGITNGAYITVANSENNDKFYYKTNNDSNWEEYVDNYKIQVYKTVSIKRVTSSDIIPIINIKNATVTLLANSLEGKARDGDVESYIDYGWYNSINITRYIAVDTNMQGKKLKIRYADMSSGNNRAQVYVKFYNDSNANFKTSGPYRSGSGAATYVTVDIPADTTKIGIYINDYSTGWSSNNRKMRIYEIIPVI